MPPVKEALAELKSRYKVIDPYSHISLTKRGEPINEGNNILAAWKRALKRSCLEHRRLYELRHSFAGNLLERGISINFTSRVLGHSSINTTLECYAGYIRGTERESEKRVAALFAGAAADTKSSTADTGPVNENAQNA